MEHNTPKDREIKACWEKQHVGHVPLGLQGAGGSCGHACQTKGLAWPGGLSREEAVSTKDHK